VNALMARIMNKATHLKWNLTGGFQTYEDIFEWEQRNNFRYSKRRMTAAHGYSPNLDNPRSFTEKAVHRRLFSRDPIWPVVTDKVEVRRWLEERGFSGNLQGIPIEGVYSDYSQIPDKFFGGPYVLKAAWASGYNIFLDNPREDERSVKARLEKWQEEPYQIARIIWASHLIPRRFLVERKLDFVDNQAPPDYKFFVFHGRVQFCQVDVDRFGDHSRLFLSRDGSRLSFSYKTPNYKGEPFTEPADFLRMVEVAETISDGFDFVRIDLFLIGRRIYFGEITQTPEAGFGRFRPSSFDFELGAKWRYNPSVPSYAPQST
jgi:hypothetical protein